MASLKAQGSPDGRPGVVYKFTDRGSAQAGANAFEGHEPNAFCGRFEANTNAFVRVRYSY